MFIGIWKWKLSTLNSPLSKEYFHSIDTENADITHLACILGFESWFFIIASFDFVRVNFIVKILNIHLVKLEVSLARQADHAPVLRTDKRCSLTLEYEVFHRKIIMCWSTWLLVPTRAECQVRLTYAECSREWQNAILRATKWVCKWKFVQMRAEPNLFELCQVQPNLGEANTQAVTHLPLNIKDYATREFRLHSA